MPAKKDKKPGTVVCTAARLFSLGSTFAPQYLTKGGSVTVSVVRYTEDIFCQGKFFHFSSRSGNKPANSVPTTNIVSGMITAASNFPIEVNFSRDRPF
jgi:hypothetical protein